MYTDAQVAALYGVLNPWGASDDFYLSLVMAAGAALDVGCGTGALLHRAREAGHAGHLAGIDPDPAMLAIARRRDDIDWRQVTAAGIDREGAFDLATMTGHAFQCLIDDAEIAASLAAIRRALAPGGAFAFETRNPARAEWREWHPGHPIDVVDGAGTPLRITYEVLDVDGDVVTLTETTSARDGGRLRVDEGRLRFLGPGRLAAALAAAGFAIEAQYGDWDGAPFMEGSPEITTIARRA